MKNVTVYSTTTCPFCDMVKEHLKNKEVEYASHDVGADAEKRQEMIEKSGQMGVPVTMIGDQVIVGFDAAAIDAAAK